MMYKNITVFQNSRVDDVLFFKNADGTVKDLTGYTLTLYVAKHTESSTKYSFPITSSNPESGEFVLELNSAEVNSLPVGNNVYSIFGTHDTLGTLLLQQGIFIVIATTFTS